MSNNDYPTKKAIEKRLRSFATLHANRQGFRFGTNAEVSITDLSKNAASKSIKQAKAEKRPQLVEVYTRIAEAALSCWVDHMIAASREIPNYSKNNPGIIGEQTFIRAKKILCPLFPIC